MGFFLLGVFSFTQFQHVSLWFIAGGIIGSYLNDCDHMYSDAGRYIQLWRWVGHRKQTHSVYFSLFCSCLLAVLNIWLGVGCMVGMTLHNLCDLTTYYGRKEGLRFMWWPYHVRQKKGA